MGIPFVPVKGILDSDYLKIDNGMKVIQDPYSSNEIAVISSIRPDVAIIHGFKGTHTGYALIDRMTNSVLAIHASNKVIISVEEIMTEDNLLPSLHQALVQPFYIDFLVQAKEGAHPTKCPGYYDWDKTQILAYIEASKSQEAFDAYLEQIIDRP